MLIAELRPEPDRAELGASRRRELGDFLRSRRERITPAQAGLHAINHLWDISKAHPKRDGPIDFALIALSAVVLGLLTWRAARRPRAP